MKKNVMMPANAVALLLIDFIYCGLLQIMVYPINSSFLMESSWSRLLSFFIENKYILYALIVFFGTFSLLYIYHISEQTKIERNLRFLVGATTLENTIYPVIILLFASCLAIIALLLIFPFNFKLFLRIFLYFYLNIIQQILLWLFLMRGTRQS